jgi:hypothetical protein
MRSNVLVFEKGGTKQERRGGKGKGKGESKAYRHMERNSAICILPMAAISSSREVVENIGRLKIGTQCNRQTIPFISRILGCNNILGWTSYSLHLAVLYIRWCRRDVFTLYMLGSIKGNREPYPTLYMLGSIKGNRQLKGDHTITYGQDRPRLH